MLPKENFNFQNLTNTVPGILEEFFFFLHYRCCQYDINADYYCYVRAGEFLTSSLEYKYRVIFVFVLGVICTLLSAVG